MMANLSFVPESPSVMFDLGENLIFIEHSYFTPVFIVKLFHGHNSTP